MPNGSKIPVNDKNKIQYIYHMANYKLNTQINPQCKAFFRGLCDLIEPRWLQMFNQVILFNFHIFIYNFNKK